jgi:hypothetical protein
MIKMFVQEDGAKEFSCPVMFFGSNRYIEECKCLGSECMAWEWVDRDDELLVGYCGFKK